MGTYVACDEPVNSARGRMRRLCAYCSRTCAVHPATRLTAKIGVNWSVEMPIDA